MFSPTSNDHRRFELNNSEVPVWYAWTPSSGDAEFAAACQRLLNEEETRRHAAFINENARLEFLTTRALVRTTLARYLDMAPDALRFQTNRYGRPALADVDGAEHPLCFNVSHSGGLIACAIAWRREIGIDVESTQGRPVNEQVARRHFAESEFEDYRRQPTVTARHARFLEYWTLKESYLKARGTGLALPLEKFTCRWSDPDRVRLTLDPELRDDPSTWQLSLRRPAAEFVAAVAVRIARAEPVRIIESFTTVAACVSAP